MMIKTSLFAALVTLLTVGCAVERDVEDADVAVEDESVEQNAEALTVKKPPTPFCLPGEVVKCTLGPPPVCRCEPVNPPILQWSVAR